MPWKRVEVEHQRIQFVIRAASGKESIQELCREFGIARPTGYRWRQRYQQAQSVQGVRERSRRPQHSPARTAEGYEQRVVALRQRYGWGAKKLQCLLAEEGIGFTVVTLNRILKRRGMVSAEDSHPPAVGRFERARPNELWQMDGKGHYKNADGTCYPLTLLDDHSRYAVGLFALPQFSAERVQACLVETFERYGVPEAMLMDHDPLWWSTTSEHGLTWLSVGLIRQGIRLHYGRVRHPQTQGQVERFHRTLNEAIQYHGRPQELAQWAPALARFQKEYNEVRPHEALGMQRPADRYRPSERPYQPHPSEWDYPQGSQVQRLNSQGCLDYKGARWFVCGALAGQWVRIESVEGQLLVSYRHMYIREIDLVRQKTEPLVVAREAPERADRLLAPSSRPPGSLRAPITGNPVERV